MKSTRFESGPVQFLSVSASRTLEVVYQSVHELPAETKSLADKRMVNAIGTHAKCDCSHVVERAATGVRL